MNTVNTNAKKFKSIVNKYILDAIDGDGYGKELNSDTEKLQFLADCFLNEYCFADNLKRYGTYQNVLSEWFQGLPSVFNIDFYDYKILELAKEWGTIDENSTEKRRDQIVSEWFSFIAYKTIQLMNKHNIDIFKTKN